MPMFRVAVNGWNTENFVSQDLGSVSVNQPHLAKGCLGHTIDLFRALSSLRHRPCELQLFNTAELFDAYCKMPNMRDDSQF